MVKLFTLLVIVFPITAIYQSPIPGIELGTFCFLLLFPFMLIHCLNGDVKITILPSLFMVLLYTLGTTLINIANDKALYTDISTILSRTVRFEFLLTAVMIIGISYWFDFKYALKILRRVTLLATTYLLIQNLLFSFTGFILPGFIEGITKMELTYSSSLNEYATAYRPTSFFLEPSSFVYYVTIYLVYVLFSKDQSSRKNRIEAFYITAGIFFSTSGQGLFVIAVLWLAWVVENLLIKEEPNNKILYIFFGLPIFIGIVWFATQSDLFSYTIGRIVADDTNYTAVNARSGGYILYNQLSMLSQIIGVGFGNYPMATVDNQFVYFSSFADILFTTGIIGSALILNMYFWAFLQGRRVQKMLCISSFLLMSGGGIYTATYLCIYLPFILFRFEKESPNDLKLANFELGSMRS